MALQELSNAVRSALATVGPATVAIGRDGRGSGLVIADGRVVTNAHNLRDRTTQVTFADGRAVQAEALGVDADGDLAVLAVETGGVSGPTWADEPVGAGDWVIALSAGGLRGQRVTAGLVSGTERAFRGPRGRRVTGSIEHTAPVPRGSSGGPLLDLAGRVVGLNTHRVERGFYLAVPADADLRRRTDDLAAGTAPEHRRLGVALAPRDVGARLRASVGLPSREGLLVRAVEEGSPAAAAGIQRGDLLVRAGDRELREPDDLFEALDAGTGSEPLTITVVRGVEELVISVSFEPGAAAQEGTA
jgi:S1-C subfamily serine protease